MSTVAESQELIKQIIYQIGDLPFIQQLNLNYPGANQGDFSSLEGCSILLKKEYASLMLRYFPSRGHLNFSLELYNPSYDDDTREWYGHAITPIDLASYDVFRGGYRIPDIIFSHGVPTPVKERMVGDFSIREAKLMIPKEASPYSKEILEIDAIITARIKPTSVAYILALEGE